MITLPARAPVFIVDDNEIERMILTKVIERSRLANEIVAFDAGRAVIACLDEVAENRAICPALILLDINMPGLTGFDVLSTIRSRSEFTEVPVIVMLSTSDADSDRLRARELGADGYLPKQSGIDRYVAAIDERFTND